MKKIFIILSIIAAAAVSSACSDWLDRQPYSFMVPEDISVENDIVNLLNGAYSTLIINRGLPMSLDFITDNGYCNDTNYGENVFWRFAQTPADMKLTLTKWSTDYAGILRANSVLYYAPQVYYIKGAASDQFQDASARKALHIAQAKVLRAYFYGDLVQYYGDCPWRTEPENLEKKISPRVDKNKIIENILLDIDDAIPYLPVKYDNLTDYGRITKGAALAIKARICLYNGHYEWCIDACRQIMELGVYSLHPSFQELFTSNYEKNNEYIFTAQYMADKTAEGASASYWSLFYNMGVYQVSYNLADDFYMVNGRPSSDPLSGFTWDAPFSNRDPRMLRTFWLYTNIDDSRWGSDHSGMKLLKYVEDNPAKIQNNDEADFAIIRYADVLLMLAESLVETGNYKYKEVCELVNQIRQRDDVKMPTIQEAEEVFLGGKLSREQLREVIRHERRVELAFEGLRLPDIQRWQIGPEVMGDCYSAQGYTYLNEDGEEMHSYRKVSFMKRTFDASKGYLWPIPSIEIQTNPMENNPGYYD